MKKNKFGEIITDEDSLCDLIMQGRCVAEMPYLTIDPAVDLERISGLMPDLHTINTWRIPEQRDISIQQFDRERQQAWFMPEQYQKLDIAEHLLHLCKTPDQLQRVAQELLMFQERNMFDLLRYLKYLVDTFRKHDIVWGVGRGSSVASYVLYLLGVHRVDSIFYELDPSEFLR